MKIDWAELDKQRILDKNRFYVIISGDKSLNENSFIPVLINDSVQLTEAETVVFTAIDNMLKTRIANGNEIYVLCGDNSGSDMFGYKYASQKDYEVIQYFADWDGNGSRAGYIRNESMFARAGIKQNKGCILFWDGEDPFTKNMIYLGWEFGIPVRVFNYKTSKWLKKDEIEEIQMAERRVQAGYRRGF